MFKLKPDFNDVLERYEAWWTCEVLDRPLVSAAYPQPREADIPWPKSTHASHRERWMDTEYTVELTVARMHSRGYGGDALPVAHPNLGPEVFSAFYGCPLEFGESTSWSEPVQEDWSPASLAALRLDRDNVYFRKILEITDALLAVAQDTFIVGYTDLHPGGDAVAAFRDPQTLCVDMIEHPAEVKALVERVTDDFLEVYDLYYDKLTAAGMPSTTWLNATCRGRYHVPSNDFSCMISNEMFEEIFLPGIIRECQHMDRNIYHLDGPQALRYLDTLLALPEIHAIQWVPGAGQDHWARWVKVYQRIQAAGKAFCLYPPVEELDEVFDALRPEGAWLIVSGVEDAKMAAEVVKKVSKWG
jgi:hypothetical protein